MRSLIPIALLLALAAPPSNAETAAQAPNPGEVVFRNNCASCHLGQVPKAPHKMFLQMMAPDAIYNALDVGIMRIRPRNSRADQKQQVATYLGGDHPVDARRAPQCTGPAATFDASREPAASGWGITPENTRHIARGRARLTAADLPRARGRSGRSRSRTRSAPVRSRRLPMARSTSAARTARSTRSTRRPAASAGPSAPRPRCARPSSSSRRPLGGKHAGRRSCIFGDLLARVYAVDAFTGELRWSYKADDHPNATITGAPTLHDGTLYVPVSSLEVTSAADPAYRVLHVPRFGARARRADRHEPLEGLHDPDRAAEVGRTASARRILAPSGAPVWNSPAIDAQRGVLYVGTGENYSSPANDTSDALDRVPPDGRRDGLARAEDRRRRLERRLHAAGQPELPGGERPGRRFRRQHDHACAMRRTADLLLAGQKSGSVYGVDPHAAGQASSGSSKVGRGGIQGGVHFGMATDGQRLFVPISDMKDEHDGRKHDDAVARRASMRSTRAPARTLGQPGRRRLHRPPVLRPGHLRGGHRRCRVPCSRATWTAGCVRTTRRRARWCGKSTRRGMEDGLGRSGARRLVRRRRRPDGRARQGVRRVGLRPVLPHARQRAAGLRAARPVNGGARSVRRGASGDVVEELEVHVAGDGRQDRRHQAVVERRGLVQLERGLVREPPVDHVRVRVVARTDDVVDLGVGLAGVRELRQLGLQALELGLVARLDLERGDEDGHGCCDPRRSVE